MPDKLRPPIPASFTLGEDRTVVVLAFAEHSDHRALTNWTQKLLMDRLIASGKVVNAAVGDRVAAVLRAHPDRLPEITGSRLAMCVTYVVALPPSDLNGQ